MMVWWLLWPLIQWGNYKQGIFQPYLLACQLPKSHWGRVPASVSIVEEPCQTATNNLRVIYNKHEGPKEKFAVCVKGLDFPDDDLSVRLGTRHNARKTIFLPPISKYSIAKIG
jgi:hypothetical protein